MSAEFDREFVADTFGLPTPEAKERLLRAKDTSNVKPVSISKELRERFAPEKKDISDVSSIVTEALGIANEDLEEVIVGDISAMINKDYRRAMEGYIFCLSRILDHTKCWEYINKAFNDHNEKVPERYRQQFGQHLSDKIQKKGPIVQ